MHLKLSSAKMAAILSRGRWANSHFTGHHIRCGDACIRIYEWTRPSLAQAVGGPTRRNTEAPWAPALTPAPMTKTPWYQMNNIFSTCLFYYSQFFMDNTSIISFAHRVDQRARPVFGRIYWTTGIIVEMASIIIEMSKRSKLYKIEIHHRNSRVGLHSLRKCHVDHIPYHITSHHPTTWHTTPNHTTPHHIASHPTSHHIMDINPLVSGG